MNQEDFKIYVPVFLILIFLVVSFLISGPVYGPILWAADTGTVTSTVMIANISLTVADGNVSYGTLGTSANRSSIQEGESQTITNAGNVSETFSVRGSTSTPGDWTLASGPGNEIYQHQFSTTTGSAWVNLTATAYTTATTTIAINGTSSLDLKIFTPSGTASTVENNVNVTVQATAT